MSPCQTSFILEQVCVLILGYMQQDNNNNALGINAMFSWYAKKVYACICVEGGYKKSAVPEEPNELCTVYRPR